ncbi:beta-ketoacyl-ACP synthase III [Paractinoplanes ferrugineus]|uniref:3-oxoacyl-[acyl-carrier-protein] synthase 3 n=1 Tax=Paractinoplanes ferrugineus TaxID=113564 RepID=A0A919MAY8_9ACTN|nr:ketoacyl-ACP synthase III [Actinoplanes ferrugineus]GIE13096.1 3-oxoacyl-[acyl-carrier-protein] synthase 3 [Actinoplanes ferrugineus]
MGLGLLSLGGYVPPVVIDNAQIAGWTGVDESWIVARTGILERRYREPGTTTSDLALRAAREALAGHPEAADRLGLIIVGTSTPDQPQPSTAAILQDKLGLPGMAAFDVNAVCCGFLYALAAAASMTPAGAAGQPAGYALVVGADVYSTLMDRTDRRTVSLFGDGAGAALLGPVPDGYGILSWRLVANGEHRDLVEVVAGGTRQPMNAQAEEAGEHQFRMKGRPVLEYAMRTLPKVIGEALDAAGLRLDQVDRVILHQGNTRMVEECGRELGLDPSRVPLTAPHFGNTAAASIPLTLSSEHERRPFRRGEHVVLAGVGGGMTAGAFVMRWY